MEVELLLDTRAELGEGPAWQAGSDLLHWLDIPARRLHSFDPGQGDAQNVLLPEVAGCLAPCLSGDLILAMGTGFWLREQSPGKLSLLDTPPHTPGNRFNDGKCDPAGRFLAGTMDDAEQQASGCLFSLDPGSGIRTLLTGLRISNGLAWSPDQATFYFIDTPTRLVMAYDYDLASGAIANPRPVIRVPAAMGFPDGMTSDTEGCLWIALWGGASVTRWDPARGRLLEKHPVPALNITSCVFGGLEHSDLYITTARKGMTPVQLEAYPLSGGLFRLETAVQGMPTFEFAGSLG